MRLTTLSDYALRVLMYAAIADDRLVTIEETAKTYDISRAHLMKVVNILTRTGYIKGVRGRSGGFTLAKRPEDINLADVVRATEPDFFRSEEHTSELQSLMRISYAVFCLKKKTRQSNKNCNTK